MTQLSLNLLCRLDAPAVLTNEQLLGVESFRDAVLRCWYFRKDHTDGAQSACARYIGARVSHMSEYLSDDTDRRDMPARFIKAFECWCGNTAISQWIAQGAKLTVLEEMQAMRAAA